MRPEILRQADALGVHFDRIIVPNGSAGTHSGLLAGVTLAHSSTQIAGYTVLATEDQAAATTLEKTRQVLQLLDPRATLAESAVSVDGSQRGEAYGAPTEAMLDAVRLLASHEGLLTDPVYGGKAFAGLLAAVRAGDYPAGSNLLYCDDRRPARHFRLPQRLRLIGRSHGIRWVPRISGSTNALCGSLLAMASATASIDVCRC